MKKSNFIFLFVLFLCFSSITAFAQMDELHGDFSEIREGVHAGNLFRTTFYNDGTFGRVDDPDAFAGEWPINEGHWYLIDGNLFVGAEVIDTDNQVQHIFSTVRSSIVDYSTGDRSPNGDWWTFLPLPGFANRDDDRIAMSKWTDSWPDVWPDKWDDPVDPGWSGSWNGYFGKDIFNADEESYFVTDDYNNAEFKFFPDATDSLRRGLGLRVYTRGFQWSNALVEDGMFVLYDIENVGTFNHDKMVFAYKFGNNMGDSQQGGDGGDDMGGFDRESDSAYLYDYDNVGGGNWTPVGYFGGVFLESPGNPFDGIDNDGDGFEGSGVVLTEDMFAPKVLGSSDEIIVIDYNTFERQKTTLNAEGVDTLKIPYQDLVFKFWAGKNLVEIPFDLVDNNLNGLIDENNGAQIGEGAEAYTTYLYVNAGTFTRVVDYFSGDGLDNTMLDERRDDGIDNDGDWEMAFDDLGQDGKANTGDPGEGDGVPTAGEPHFDAVDIDETDMIGLTSFTLYLWPDIPHYDDQTVWDNVLPGFFDQELLNANIELLYGSGYFPLKAGTTERFSMGILCGVHLEDYLENVGWYTRAYTENYNFSKAPNIPNVTAIAGNRKVTLVWDTIAEESVDPITGEDFEGYKIYRSTDPGWKDAVAITDGSGVQTFRKPFAQFDVDNEYEGFHPVHIKGIRFWMGDNSGIVNSFTDTTVVNGQTYFYAVTSYDHGSVEGGISPTECNKFITLNTAGEVEDKGSNVVQVVPNAPANGFLDAALENLTLVEGGYATGVIGYEIINSAEVIDQGNYRIVFEDTLIESAARNLVPSTKNFSLINLDSGDTLINKSTLLFPGMELPIVDGFRVQLFNDTTLVLNADSSMWVTDSSIWIPDSAGRALHDYEFIPYKYSRTYGIPKAFDYMIEFFDEPGADTSSYVEISSSRRLPETPVNYTVTNLTTGDKVETGFYELDELSDESGMFTAFTDRTRSDQILFLENTVVDQETTKISWAFEFGSATRDSLHRNPKGGDVVYLKTRKPFLSNDIYEFKTSGQRIEDELIDLDQIRVVPNPYVVSNSWEPTNPYANGRGPRVIQFTHLPLNCTLRIFNIRGQLIREVGPEELTDDGGLNLTSGAYAWDMLTKDLLDISYGIYIYHVDAGEYGSKIGKFAVIK